jgi:hypothetical protein
MPFDGRWGLNIPDTDNQLFNNIVLSSHSYRGSILIGTPVSPDFASDYNVVIDRFANDGEGDSILSLAEWQALGYDQHSFIASPDQLFVNAGSQDYHLKTGSLAIDQGTLLADVLTDLEGHARPVGGGYDIGAYEFQPALILSGVAGDGAIFLAWTVNSSLPPGDSWTITYTGPKGDQPSPITGIAAATRAYTLTGLTNYAWYDITLTAVGTDPVLSGTVKLMPIDQQVYLPMMRK